MCRVLEVSSSGYYAWRRRSPSPRTVQNEALVQTIVEVFEDHRGNYGSPRVFEEIRAQGEQVGLNRVARLMHQNGLKAVQKRSFRKTTDSSHDLPVAENLLGRCFKQDRPDQAWVGDITYIRTSEGWLYLAVILDLFSRRVIGWSMADHMRTELVANALKMALGSRIPEKGMLHHSDRGSQYASHSYRNLLEKNGITCSMSRRGECYDNAVAESFFGTLKTELIYRKSWPDRHVVRSAIHEYIEVYYNRKRRHSTLGYSSPVEFEAHYYSGSAA